MKKSGVRIVLIATVIAKVVNIVFPDLVFLNIVV